MLRETLTGLQQTEGRSLQLGLIVFGKNVSIYQLGIASGILASADVVATHRGLSADKLKLRAYLTDATDAEAAVDALLTCLSAHYGVSFPSRVQPEETNNLPTAAPLSSPKKSRMEQLRERKEARLRKQQSSSSDGTPTPSVAPAQSPWSEARDRIKALSPPFRCTGEALQCAMDLVSVETATTAAVPTRTARILLFTNGCPNYGDGSVVLVPPEEEGRHILDASTTTQAAAYTHVDPAQLARAVDYYTVTAKAAAEGGVGVDVFCAGSSQLGLPAYHALVEPSAGYVLSHDSFATEQVQRNVEHLLRNTFLSLALLDEGEENEDPASPMHEGAWMDGCTIDLRMSSCLNPTHLIGPGDLVDKPEVPLANEHTSFELGAALAEKIQQRRKSKNNNPGIPSQDILESTLTRIRLGRYDPLATFSVMMRLNEFFQNDEFVFIQCTVRYVEENGETLVTRVSTHRISVAKSAGEFLEAVDEEVIPVLLGKEAVYRAMFGRELTPENEPESTAHSGQADNLAYDSQRDLDVTVHRISGAFRLLTLEKGTRT
jgi:hypothetical protein